MAPHFGCHGDTAIICTLGHYILEPLCVLLRTVGGSVEQESLIEIL